MKSHEIRHAFLEFFEAAGHRVVPSSPVIPAGDPTLLFTNAGMNQFKDVFLGREERPYRRAASVQKCIRAGGKHNDLELVGKTARHLTFFEMLGNFSFGDYFKEEAIRLAWRLLIDGFGLPPDRLWVSVFREDEESRKIWRDAVGVPDARIHRLGEKDNFWSMGDTGPCGPCTEIGIDRGAETGCGRPDCDVGCECDRYLELWNLVFMQFDRGGSGEMRPLPSPSVDTGMGLERISAVLQGVPTNFHTDLLEPLIRSTARIAGVERTPDVETSLRVVADHVRALVFAIVDGAVPSNEGRGYVLRRILRRAARHGRILGIGEPFLHRLVPDVAAVMGDAYPELAPGCAGAARVIRGEEERFGQTLDQGLSLFEKTVRSLDGRVIPGDRAFLLYDTFGFPLDLTVGMAEERGLTVDVDGFDAEMERQRARARGSRETRDRQDIGTLGLVPVEFEGYTSLEGRGSIQRIEAGGESVESVEAGTDVSIDLTRTPFYGESGGQQGDHGTLRGAAFLIDVLDTQAPVPGRRVHAGRVREGVVRLGDEVEARVDVTRRAGLKRAHTATHLLHHALRTVLGSHVKQAGSLVAPDRLRFDFTHYEPVSPVELAGIEEIVREHVILDAPVTTETMSFAEAKARGALAFFDEKYGERVRVVDIAGFSTELCGGTHVSRTGEIGGLLVLSEGSISAGVRRLEAIVGMEAFRHVSALRDRVDRLGKFLRVPPEDVEARVAELWEENRRLQRENRELTVSRARAGLEVDTHEVRTVEGIPLVVRRVDVPDVGAMRRVADEVRNRLVSGVAVLGAEVQGKAMLIVTVSPDLVERRGLDAVRIVREIAAVVEGSGGGKPHMAQAGGRRVEGLDAALEAAEGAVRGMIDA